MVNQKSASMLATVTAALLFSDPALAFRPAVTRAANQILVDWSHYTETCPSCGEPQWRIYRRDEISGSPWELIRTQKEPSHADAPQVGGIYRYRVEIQGNPKGFTDTASVESAAIPFDTVPPPFTTVQLNGSVVQVLGRSYDFAAGPVPVSISVLGSVLEHGADVPLGAAPELSLVVDGQTHDALSWGAPSLVSQLDDQVVLTTTASAGAAELEATITVEFDGSILVDLAISGPAGTSLDDFAYTLHWASVAVSRYFYHHVEYDTQAINIDRDEYLNSSGDLPIGPVGHRFVPTFTIGNQEVALEWSSESNDAWTGTPDAELIHYGGGGGTAYLEINPLPDPVILTGVDPWRHVFSLIALPARPRDAGALSRRFDSWNAGNLYRHDIGLDHAWIAFPLHAYTQSSGLPLMNTRTCVPGEDYFAQPNSLAACSNLGNDQAAVLSLLDGLNPFVRPRFIPYGAMARIPGWGEPNILDAMVASHPSWRANQQVLTGPTADSASLGRYGYPGHDPAGPYWSYWPCFDGALGALEADGLTFGQYMAEKILEGLTDPAGGIDALYFDFGNLSRQCVERVGVDRELWNYFDVREFWKNLYVRIAASTNPDAIVTAHLATGPKATGAFVDVYFVGEPLKAVWKNPLPYVPDYLALPPGFLEAQMFPRPGGEVSLLPELRLDAANEGTLAHYRGMRMLLGLHGWQNWTGNFGSSTSHDRSVVQATYLFGSLEDARFDGYWTGNAGVSSPEALVSTWTTADKALVFVGNPGTTAVSDASLDLTALPPELANVDSWLDLEDAIETCNITYGQGLSATATTLLGGRAVFGCGPGSSRNPDLVLNTTAASTSIGEVGAGDFRVILLCQDGVSCNDEAMVSCLVDADCDAGQVCSTAGECVP